MSSGMEPESQSTLSHSARERIRHIAALYRKNLEEHPVLTKAITSAVLAGIGDITSQWIIRISQPTKKSISWRSVAAFSTFSLVVTGPVTHYLYQFLEAVVPRKSRLASVRKVVLDRLLFAPPYLLALFYTVALMEGNSPREAWEKVKAIYWSALVRNWVIWGAAQYINMSYIPVKYRVLFANFVALVWNIYLAILRR